MIVTYFQHRINAASASATLDEAYQLGILTTKPTMTLQERADIYNKALELKMQPEPHQVAEIITATIVIEICRRRERRVDGCS